MISNAKRNKENKIPRLILSSLIPLSAALVLVPLPLPEGIVTAAVSPV